MFAFAHHPLCDGQSLRAASPGFFLWSGTCGSLKQFSIDLLQPGELFKPLLKRATPENRRVDHLVEPFCSIARVEVKIPVRPSKTRVVPQLRQRVILAATAIVRPASILIVLSAEPHSEGQRVSVDHFSKIESGR